jgi:hypothetical protein
MAPKPTNLGIKRCAWFTPTCLNGITGFKRVNELVGTILQRCERVQQRLGSRGSGSHSSTTCVVAEHGARPPTLTSRSLLLYEQHNQNIQQQQHQQEEEEGEEKLQSINAPSPPTAWAGAVDLNPGGRFLPGSPQHVASSCGIPRISCNPDCVGVFGGNDPCSACGQLTHRVRMVLRRNCTERIICTYMYRPLY